MYKITYYIGCNDKDTLKQELSYNDFIIVFQTLFKDFTLQKGKRYFTNAKGYKTIEQCFVITLITDNIKEFNDNIIKINCDKLKTRLNQESILVTKELIQASFM